MKIDKIRRLLGDRNLAEVGRRIGVTRTYLHYIKQGQVTSLSPAMSKKLGDYLELNK